MTKLHHFPESLKAIRLKKGFTHKGLSEEIGCDESLISHLERGATEPSFEKFVRIGVVLDCSYDDLIKGEHKK